MRLAIFSLSVLLITPFAWGDRPGERARGPQKVEGIDQEEGRVIMEQFRHQRLRGDFVFQFDLVHRPRRDKEVIYEGTMWGTWNELGSLDRVSVWPKGKRATDTRELIVQGGTDPQVWMLRGDKVVKLSLEEQGQPFFPEMVYTPYDVVMPFAYWDIFEYTGSKRMALGRPAHMFVLYAPADVAKRMPEMAAVELALDADFNAPLTAKMLDINGKALRTLAIGGFKEIDDQYIVKEIELLDERARDKTTFRVTGAAVNLALPPEIFEPANLKEGEPDVTKIIFEPI